MLEGIFNLIDPRTFEKAHARVFAIRCKQLFGETCFDETLSAVVKALRQQEAFSALEDTPALRTWMWSIKKLKSANQGRGDAVPMEALGHLTLDAPLGDRVIELLALQLVGIVAGQALKGGTTFSFRSEIAAPLEMYLDGVGLLKLGNSAGGSPFVVDVSESTLAVGVSNRVWVFDTRIAERQGELSFIPSVKATTLKGPLAELAHMNSSLSRPEFQPFPQMLGLQANMAWHKDISACCAHLDETELPNMQYILAQCKAIIGLVSMTEAIGSGSREEALGLVYLPAGAALLDLAECLLHECLHQLLFRLEEAAPLFDSSSDRAERYFSPWRTDARPLRMVLHGAFVFSGVATLQMLWFCHPPSDPRLMGDQVTAYRRLHESLTAVNTVKRHAILTTVGRKVVNAIEAQLRYVEGRLTPSAEASASVHSEIKAKRDAFPSYIT